MESQPATVLEVDDTAVSSESNDTEALSEDWDELTPLVAANADVIICCPWLDNAEMPLGPAMHSIQVDINRDNIDEVVAEVRQMLTIAAEKKATQESEEPEETEEAIADKKPEKEPVKSAPQETKTQHESKQEKVAPATQAVESSTENATTTQAIEPTEKVISTSPGEQHAESTDIEVASEQFVAERNTPKKTPEVEPVEVDDEPTAQSLDIIVDNTEDYIEPEEPQELLISELEVPDTEVDEMIRDLLDFMADERDVDVKPQTVLTPEDIESIAENTPMIPIVELEVPAAEFDAEADVETTEDATTIASTEILGSEEAEASTEIEIIFAEIVERVHESEPNAQTELAKIIEKIIEIPNQLDPEILDQTEAQEELEELFTELFEILEIDYTPELIEDLAKTILKTHLTGTDLEEILHMDEADENDQTQSLHSSSSKHLATLKDLKKVLAHAYNIGRSAMKVYSLSFSS